MSKAVACYKKNPGIVLDIFGDNSAQALFQFENNLFDSLGNYPLSVYSTLDNPTYTKGVIGNAATGTNTGFTTKQGISIISSNSYTVSCWVRQVNTDSGWPCIIAQGPDTGYGIMILPDPDTYNLMVSYGHAANIDTDIDLSSTWQHIVISSDGANGAKAYLNGSWIKDLGVLDSNTDSNNNTNSTLIKVYRNNAVDTFPFPGDIDHLRVFNRAVTASEVTTLYNEK